MLDNDQWPVAQVANAQRARMAAWLGRTVRSSAAAAAQWPSPGGEQAGVAFHQAIRRLTVA